MVGLMRSVHTSGKEAVGTMGAHGGGGSKGGVLGHFLVHLGSTYDYRWVEAEQLPGEVAQSSQLGGGRGRSSLMSDEEREHFEEGKERWPVCLGSLQALLLQHFP